jgi:hypothetical protein
MLTQNSLGLQQIRNLEHEHTQLVKMNKHQNDKKIFRKLIEYKTCLQVVECAYICNYYIQLNTLLLNSAMQFKRTSKHGGQSTCKTFQIFSTHFPNQRSINLSSPPLV